MKRMLTLAAILLGLPMLAAVPSHAGGWSFGLSYSSGYPYYGRSYCAPAYVYRPAVVYRSYYAPVYYHYRAPVRSVYVERVYAPKYRAYRDYDRHRDNRHRSSFSVDYGRYGRHEDLSISYRSGGGGWVPGYVDGHGRYVPGYYR
ncbi:hypothetical protein HS125_06070 [bacterium]|nr:hypothetical protein [bacterium]